MDVGIGLPSGIPGAQPDDMLAWAEEADRGPFASVGVIDRHCYDSYDPLIALAGAAAVTTRVKLATCIIAAPLREVTSLAKQVASLDALSNGRMVLGVAVGARQDDYDISEFPFEERGERLDSQLARLRGIWEDNQIGPHPVQPGGPKVLVGGMSGRAMARAARFGSGYVFGGGPPRAFAKAADRARAAWADLGRSEEPQLWAQAYFALGDAADKGRDYMLEYYAFTGPFAHRIADGLLTTPLDVREFVTAYADAGCHHLQLFPAVSTTDQVSRLAEALPA